MQEILFHISHWFQPLKNDRNISLWLISSTLHISQEFHHVFCWRTVLQHPWVYSWSIYDSGNVWERHSRVCNKAIDTYLSAVQFVPHWYKSQKMCYKPDNTYPFVFFLSLINTNLKKCLIKLSLKIFYAKLFLL